MDKITKSKNCNLGSQHTCQLSRTTAAWSSLLGTSWEPMTLCLHWRFTALSNMPQDCHISSGEFYTLFTVNIFIQLFKLYNFVHFWAANNIFLMKENMAY